MDFWTWLIGSVLVALGIWIGEEIGIKKGRKQLQKELNTYGYYSKDKQGKWWFCLPVEVEDIPEDGNIIV